MNSRCLPGFLALVGIAFVQGCDPPTAESPGQPCNIVCVPTHGFRAFLRPTWHPGGDWIYAFRNPFLGTTDTPASRADCGYILDPAQQGVWRVSPDGADVEEVLLVPTSGFDISPDGSRLAFAEHGLRIWTVDLVQGLPDPSSIRMVGSGGLWPDWSPDGRRIAFSMHVPIGGRRTGGRSSSRNG